MHDSDRHDSGSENSGGNGAGIFARLQKTRRRIGGGLAQFFSAQNTAADWDELHDQLILADVGVDAGEKIIRDLRSCARGGMRAALQKSLTEILAQCERAPMPHTARPHVIFMLGVNGAGKTTTLAKIGARLQREGKSVMFAACDTFRAAAIEQLQIWGRRLNAEVIAQKHGADPAAVAFDAYAAARARAADVLLIDTAGRRHTDSDLMGQLKKMRRVLQKADEKLPHETLLTLDAGTGQNAISQVETFHREFGVDGLCIAKLDGTAKGGIVVALAMRFGIAVRYLGAGESLEELRAFSAEEYAAALLPREN